MLLVVALGGNALLEPGQVPDAETQRSNIRRAIEPIAALARAHDLVITHGNGPQVGLLALQSEALASVPGYPLDILDAESEGMLGYLIEQEIGNALPGREVATLLSRVEVAADDPAFETPSKPVGPVYTGDEARRLARERGWAMRDDGAGFRRLVASPKPRRILGLAAVRTLVEAGHIVVCAGGGGIPVTVDAEGVVRGVEAVVDKDHASALLARELDADSLLLLTGEPVVWSAWPRARGRAISSASPAALQGLTFEAGTMGPKVEAACEFATRSDKTAYIGALEDAARIVEGRAGTAIRPSGELAFYADDSVNVARDAR